MARDLRFRLHLQLPFPRSVGLRHSIEAALLPLAGDHGAFAFTAGLDTFVGDLQPIRLVEALLRIARGLTAAARARMEFILGRQKRNMPSQ